MIADVDAALRSLLTPKAREHGAEVSLEAPTRDWADRRAHPTLDVYLFDIREEVDLRRVAREPQLDGQDRVVGHTLPPRFFRLSYLLTAWTQNPEDEHRMLADALQALVAMPVLPRDALDGWLADQPEAVRLELALPLDGERTIADLWTALGGELKPSLEIAVTAPVETRAARPAAPLTQQRVLSTRPHR